MYGCKKNSHTLKSKPVLQANKSKALQKSSKELKCLLLNREEQLLKKMEKLLIISAQSDSFRGVVLINRLLCKVFFKGERGQEREREGEREAVREGGSIFKYCAWKASGAAIGQKQFESITVIPDSVSLLERWLLALRRMVKVWIRMRKVVGSFEANLEHNGSIKIY